MSRCGRRGYDTTLSSVPCNYLLPGDVVKVGDRFYHVLEAVNVMTVRIAPMWYDVLWDEAAYCWPALAMAAHFFGLLMLLWALVILA